MDWRVKGWIRVRGWGAHPPYECCSQDTGEAGWSSLCSDFSGFLLIPTTLVRKKQHISKQQVKVSSDTLETLLILNKIGLVCILELAYQRSSPDSTRWIFSFSSCDRWRQTYLWRTGFSESGRAHTQRSRADRKAYIPQLFLHTNRAGIRTESCPKWGSRKGQEQRRGVLGNREVQQHTG